MVWERYCYASPKPELFFIFFVYIFIHISANTSPFGLQFSQMILHTETSTLMYNWSFLFVVLHKPTLLPSTFKHIVVRIEFCWILGARWSFERRDISNASEEAELSLILFSFPFTPHALCTGSHHRASLIDRLQSFPKAVLRNLFASGWSARSLFSAFENFLISNMFYN